MDNELHKSDRLNIVRQLYDEAGAAPRSDSDTELLLAEQQAMSEAKFLLDHRRKQRPDVDVLDRIVETAKAPTALRMARRDRRPQPLRSARILPMRMAMAACTLFVAVGVGYVVLDQEPTALDDGSLAMDPGAAEGAFNEIVAERLAKSPAPPVAIEEAEALLADLSSEVDQSKDADETFAASKQASGIRAKPSVVAAPVGAAEERADRRQLTAWDELDNVVVLRRRIDRLNEASAALEWDDAAVPLEMLPVDSAVLRVDGPVGRQLVGAPKSKN